MKRLALVLLISVGVVMAVIPIQIESFTCAGNEDYCQNLNCSMETIRKKMQVFNFDCNFPRTIDNLMIRFTVFKKGSKYQLIDSTEDLCKVISKTERSNVVSRLLPMWNQYGHIPNSCPAKGEVKLRRYPLDLSFYPSTFPSGNFRTAVMIYESVNHTSILNVTSTFSVKYVGI